MDKEGVIDYHGEVNDVKTFLNQGFCCILPSWYREGTPRSLLESLACGTPIITINHIGCRETIRDSYNGFICESENTSSIIDSILKLEALSTEQYLRMRENSRYFAEQNFDEKFVIQHYIDAIKQLNE